MAELPDLLCVVPPPTRWPRAGRAYLRWPDGAETASMPTPGARLDTVFGAPILLEAVLWPRTERQVAAVLAEIQDTLAAHVEAACALTGQSLPAMPTIR